MSKQKWIFISIILLVLLTGCNSNNVNQNKNTVSDTTEQPQDINQDSSQTQPDTTETTIDTSNMSQTPPISEVDQSKPDRVETETQYYVNDKYFIKPVITEASNQSKEKIALLTFDDSPAGESTETILDILDKYDAKAIWFINGYYADKHKDLLKEIHDRGHIIGNHTWWHKNFKLDKLNPEETREEIVSINDLVEEVIGERPSFFRAPNGTYTDEAKKVIHEENMQYMNWSVGSLDWELKKTDDIEKQVLSTIHNGSVILFHDKKITSEALDHILSKLSEEGYKFVLPTEVKVQ